MHFKSGNTIILATNVAFSMKNLMFLSLSETRLVFTKLNFRCHNPEGKSPHLKCFCTCSFKSACIHIYEELESLWKWNNTFRRLEDFELLARWSVILLWAEFYKYSKTRLCFRRHSQPSILQRPILWNR